MDTSILDTMLNNVASFTTGASGTIVGYAQSTFGLLIILDFTLAVLLNLGEVDHIKQTVKKVLIYGFWIWVIQNWGMLCDVVLDSLMMTGTAIGGVDASVLKHPSKLIDFGLYVAKPYWDYACQLGWTEIAAAPQNWLMAIIGYLGVVTAFAVLALQIFITYVEFYIAAALLLIFIPWGSFKFTSFMAEKAIGAVISYGTKLMVLGAIYGLSSGILNNMTIELSNGEPTPVIVFASMLAPLLLGLLCWQAPGMAAGLMNGAPSLTAGTMAGTATASAAGAAAGVASAVGVGKGAAALGGTVGGGAAKTAANLAGMAVGGAKGVDENTSPASGAVSGVARGVAGAVGSAASSAFSAAKNGGPVQRIKSAFETGKSYGSSGGGGNSPNPNNAGSSKASGNAGTTGTNSMGAAADNTSAGNANGATSNNAFASGNASAMSKPHTSTAATFKEAINKSQQAVPEDAVPQGGFSVPLPKNDD